MLNADETKTSLRKSQLYLKMADVSCRCLLVKGLPADAKEQDLAKCLENRRLDVLKVHSHIESQTDKRWIILLPDSKAVRECIKQGSWKVTLQSGEITVTPDYCSECIVPDDWTQKEEDSDQESLDESWIKLESLASKEFHDLSGSFYSHSSEEPTVTLVHGADCQTANFDTQEKLLQQASEDDTVENFSEEIYQHAKFAHDRPLSEKVRPKDANGVKGNHTNSDPDESFHGAYCEDIGPQSELLILKCPNMIDHGTDYTPLQSGSIIIGKKYTNDLSCTGLQEDMMKDTDHDSIQTKTMRVNKGPINLTSTRSSWSSLVTPGVKEEVFKQDRDSKRNSGHGHEKLHLPPICSKDKVGIDEDKEGQTDVCCSQHYPSSDIEDLDYTVKELDIKDDHISSQPLKENSMNEKPEVAWSYEDPSVHNERPLSPLRTPVKDKAIKIEVPQPHTGISPQRMTMPEPQLIIEGYPPNLTMSQPSQGVPSQDMTMTTSNMMVPQPHVEVPFERLTMPQPSTLISPQTMTIPEPQLIIEGYPPNLTMSQPSQGVPSQDMTMTIPNMKMPQQHATVSFERLKVLQHNTDTHLLYMGMPRPVTELSIQGMHVPSWPVNSPVATGQVKVSGGTERYMVPPGFAGHYLYNSWQTMSSVPPDRYQMNYGAYPLGPYGPMHPSPPFTQQYVPTTFSQPSCPPSQASFMYSIPSLRLPLGSQPTQGGFFGLELQRDIAGQRAAVSQNGPVEEDGGLVNKTGRVQNISNAESIEQTRTADRHERVRIEQNPNIMRRDDSDMKVDRPQSQIYPKLGEDQFQYNKDSVKNKGHLDRVNLRYSQKNFPDDRLGPMEGFESHKEASSDAYMDHTERGMNINMPVERLSLGNAAERVYSVDSEGYARMKEANKDSGDNEDSALEKIESKPQKDQEDDESLRMIRVQGLAKSISQDALELFFENKKRCGGGEIESLEWGRSKGEAFITFKDPSVVQRVLEKQKREPFHLEQLKLTVEEYVPPPPDPLRLFLKNLSPRVTQELLLLYLESCCNTTPSEILFGRLPGTALVTFSKPPDVGLLLRKVKERSLEGQNIEVIRIPITCCVQLTGLPLSTTRDAVLLYFENRKRSGGGPVKDLKFRREKQSCVVSFKNSEDAERVCTRSHTINKKDIQVCLYYECLDDDLDTDEFSDLTHRTEGTVGELKLPDPFELKDLNPQILKFLVNNEKHRQMFEKNLSDVNGVAKWPSSVEGYVIIECTVKMEDKSAISILKDWSIRVVDKVNSFTAGIEVVKFNPIKMTWSGVIERLQTVTIDNPEDLGVFVEQEKCNITVVGPKAAVETLKRTILDIIVKVETLIELEKQSVTETKQMKTYEMILLRASNFKQDIEKMCPGLRFDLNLKDKKAIFVGQADIVQKAMVTMHEKLQSFVSITMPMSKAAKDLLFIEEITDYINQKMKSQKIIGVWDEVHEDEIQMFGQDKSEVQKAIRLVRDSLVEKEISLDDVMAQNVRGQQWSRLVQRIQEKHTRKVAIETSMRSVLIVAVDDIFQDVFDEIKVYLEKHYVEEVFLELDPVRVKFIRRYKNEDIKALEKKFESSHVKLSIIDYEDQKGIKINCTKDICRVVKTELSKMANTVITKEHIVVGKVGLKEFLQGSKGRDQLRMIETRFKCFMVMKDSSTSSSLQQKGASGGYSSKSEDDAGQSYEPMDWQHSTDRGDSIDAWGIKVFVVQGELAKQKVDVIVNSVSQDLDLKIGAVSKTILKYGGDSIQSECLQQYPSGLNPGQVVVTSGGRLNCTKVYHGCLRSYDGSHGKSIELMKTFVINCLMQADKSGYRSMAFPALGTGNLAFPADEVGKLMVQCIQTFGKKTPNTTLKDIALVVYPSDINIIKAFTAAVGGNTVPSASPRRSPSSFSNISIVHGICRCTLPNSVVLEIVQGDITKETTNVIVNSVLSVMDLSQGEVSKAILTAGGMSIQQECQVKDSDFKKHGYVVTGSGQLQHKMIIHMAAQDDGQKWEDMIKKVLFRAEQSRCWSISFPALGTGGKGLSPEKIAQAMYSACTEFAESQQVWLKKIRVVLFQEAMLTTFVQAIKVHSSGQVSRTPVGERNFRSGSKQSDLVFNITANSEFTVQAAVKDLEDFVKKEFFI